MDRIYNNEFFASCVVLKILDEGLCDVARLSVCLVLAMDDDLRKARKRECSFERYVEQVCGNCNSYFNNKYKDYLILFVNTIVMLSQADAVSIVGGDIMIDNRGSEMLTGVIAQIPSLRLHQVLQEIPHLVNMLKCVSVGSLFNRLNVEL